VRLLWRVGCHTGHAGIVRHIGRGEGSRDRAADRDRLPRGFRSAAVTAPREYALHTLGSGDVVGNCGLS